MTLLFKLICFEVNGGGGVGGLAVEVNISSIPGVVDFFSCRCGGGGGNRVEENVSAVAGGNAACQNGGGKRCGL